MRRLFSIRFVLALALLAIAIYRSGFRVWPMPIAAWHWAMAAILPLTLLLLRVIMSVERTTPLLKAAWFVLGIGATVGCAWLCWYTWAHPTFGNWFAIPAIGSLAIFAVFIFWIPLVNSFRKATRLVNRVQAAVEGHHPDAERCLWEARQIIGTGGSMEQMYLDAFEGRLRCSQDKPRLALDPLQRALKTAFARNDRSIGCYAADMLVRVLNALSREKEAAALADQIEAIWGDAPEVRAALQVRQPRSA